MTLLVSERDAGAPVPAGGLLHPVALAALGLLVLNDHWADMAREGFVSNRIFDALATGAPVVSDSVPGLSDSLGGLVRTYETPDDLRRIVLDIEREPEEARAERARSVARRERIRRLLGR